MEQHREKILSNVRDLALSKGIEEVTINDICNKSHITKAQFYELFHNDEELVRQVLERERKIFSSIFDQYQFDGMNAIDILLTVSNEINKKFHDLNPFLLMPLEKTFPKIYKNHIDLRLDFIFKKISINLEKGIRQGMYRKDLSIELLARLYISKLIDLHNPKLFISENYSFNTLFVVMFDNFIRGIVTDKGLKVYEAKAVMAEAHP